MNKSSVGSREKGAVGLWQQDRVTKRRRCRTTAKSETESRRYWDSISKTFVGFLVENKLSKQEFTVWRVAHTI